MIADTSQSTFLFPPFPITAVPLILCYSRFIVNTVTGVFIKHSSEPRAPDYLSTEDLSGFPFEYSLCHGVGEVKVEQSFPVSEADTTEQERANQHTAACMTASQKPLGVDVFLFSFHCLSSFPSSFSGLVSGLLGLLL